MKRILLAIVTLLLLSISVSSDTVRLTWNPSVDNVGVVGYKIYREGVHIGTTTETSYMDTNLPHNATFSYTIKSYDLFGNESALSAPLSVTTNYDPGAATQAFYFIGDDHSFVRVNNQAPYAFSSSFTVSFWIKASTQWGGQFRAILGMKGSSPESGWDVGLGADGKLATTLRGTTNLSSSAFGNDLRDNKWHLVVIVATTSSLKTYVDGTVISNVTGTWVPTTNTNPFVMGNWAIYNTNGMIGGLDDVRLFNRALTPEEVSVVDTVGDGLIGYWPFDTNTTIMSAGTTLDSSGNNNTGTFATSGEITAITRPVGTPSGPDTEAPSVPSGVLASPSSTSQINVSWAPSSDNVEVVGYKIFRDGTQVGTSELFSFSDTGLATATSYAYRVSAYDAAGNESAQSAIVNASTLQNPPSAPDWPTVAVGASGAVLPTTGVVNQAFDFGGGPGSYVAVTNQAPFNFTSDFSVSFHIKLRTDQFIGGYTQANVISKVVGNTGWQIILQSTGVLKAFGRGTTTISGGATIDLRDGNWHHIVVAFTPSSITFYHNGSLEVVRTGTWVPVTNTLPLGIGSGGDTDMYPMIGALDEVRIFNHALNLTEVGTADTLTTGLVGGWSFDTADIDLVAGTATDSSGNGYTATYLPPHTVAPALPTGTPGTRFACPAASHPAPTGSGIRRYVSPTGGGDGSSSGTPTTLSAAISAALPGDVVELAAGTYAGQYTINNKHGTATDRITFDSAPGSELQAIISGGDANIFVINSSYLTFRNIRFTAGRIWGFGIGNLWETQPPPTGPSHFLVLDHIEVDHPGQEGIMVHLGSINTTIFCSKVHDTGVSNPGYAEGIYLGNVTGTTQTIGVLVEGNEIWNTTSEAIDKKILSKNVIIRNNLIHDINTSNSGAVVIDIGNTDWPDDTNCLIENNYIWNITRWSAYGDGNGINLSGSCTVRNNVIWNVLHKAILLESVFAQANNRTVRVYNNTAWGCTSGYCFGPATSGPYIPQADVRNNISPDNTFGSASYKAVAGDFVGPLTGTADAGTGPGSGFMLAPTSGAKDKGETIASVGADGLFVTRPQGSAYDFGAFELP